MTNCLTERGSCTSLKSYVAPSLANWKNRNIHSIIFFIIHDYLDQHGHEHMDKMLETVENPAFLDNKVQKDPCALVCAELCDSDSSCPNSCCRPLLWRRPADRGQPCSWKCQTLTSYCCDGGVWVNSTNIYSCQTLRKKHTITGNHACFDNIDKCFMLDFWMIWNRVGEKELTF